MRYMIVTYEETGLPTKDYSLFDVLGRFLTEEGLNCTLADMHAPSEVMDHVAPSRSLLEKLLTSVEIIEDELGGVPEVGEETWERLKAVWDETASMRTLIEDELSPPYDEKEEITGIWFDEAAEITEAQINYLIPSAHQATPIVIVGEESCEKGSS